MWGWHTFSSSSSLVYIFCGAAGEVLLHSQLCVCVLTLIRCPFHPRVTAVARKRPRSFCPKCRWQVTPEHAYSLDPTKSEWADYVAIQALCGNLSGNELTRNSLGNTRSQSSQVAEPLWTDPGLKSGISVRELVSTKKKKKRRRAMICRTFSPNPRTRGKKHHHHRSAWRLEMSFPASPSGR